MSDRNRHARRGLRQRQRQRLTDARAFDRIEACHQPPEPTRQEIAELVENAGPRQWIQLEVPRSQDPKRPVSLRRGSIGPTCDPDRPIKWDGQRRCVTADWRVEDLRRWVERSLVEAGGMEVDLEAREIRHGDVTASAQVMTLAILGALVRHEGSTLTPERLHEDTGCSAKANALRRQMCAIRALLDSVGAAFELSCEFGTGYRIELT